MSEASDSHRQEILAVELFRVSILPLPANVSGEEAYVIGEWQALAAADRKLWRERAASLVSRATESGLTVQTKSAAKARMAVARILMLPPQPAYTLTE